MRGKGAVLLSDTAKRGITPAHAGKSISLGISGGTRMDHPRPCGEKIDDLHNTNM